jgi:hypothetical protein
MFQIKESFNDNKSLVDVINEYIKSVLIEL